MPGTSDLKGKKLICMSGVGW